MNKMVTVDSDLFFAKVKYNAIIPSKRDEDGAMDVYACFEQDHLIIEPHETRMIPTGIASAFSPKYVAILKERGSNCSKGIAQRCCVIDSGYRNEWFVPLTNTNDYSVLTSPNLAIIFKKPLYSSSVNALSSTWSLTISCIYSSLQIP